MAVAGNFAGEVMDPRLKRNPFGFWEIANKPTPAELQKYYADKYYQEEAGSYSLQYESAEIQYFQTKLEQRFAVLERHLGVGRTGRMLDVGCGEGYALKYFRTRGWSVKGFDFSNAGMRAHNPDVLDALLTGDVFDSLRAEIAAKETYDAVWLQNVLEHVIDPVDLLRTLRGLTGPTGMLVVTLPNDCSVTQQALLKDGHLDSAFWVAPPDHLSYFDCDTFANTARETGWDCLHLLADFPVDWFLFNPGSNYIRDRSRGKAAHRARLHIENLLHSAPIDRVLDFWTAAARLGVGRNFTAFLRPRALGAT
jgi:2-polyprenyl-3-methyl-5-hydroxy-6-metoxy-1,4-benzoquinol methylase